MAFLIHVCLLAVATSESVVRREKQADISLHLSAGGEMIYNKGEYDDLGNTQTQETTMLNTCDDDYPLGVVGKNQCQHPGFDSMIINRELCIEAAKEAGVMTIHSKFDVQELGGWRWTHPKGCFKISCDEAHAGHAANATEEEKKLFTGFCYFYNPIGTNPPDDTNQLDGVPVCSRPKLIQGSIDATTKAATCKEGFSVIMNENNCSEAATCLGKCKGKLFKIDEEVNSKFEDYPEGCFIEENTGCVYFNPRPNNWPNAPQTPVGTPLCNVSAVTLATTWPSSPAPAPASGGNATAAAPATPAGGQNSTATENATAR